MEKMIICQRDIILKRLLKATEGVGDHTEDESTTIPAQTAQMVTSVFGSAQSSVNVAPAIRNLEKSVNRMVKDLPIDSRLQ